MDWYVNDLSMEGQFIDAAALREALEPLIKLRLRQPDWKSRVYCSRRLQQRPAINETLLQNALFATPDQVFKRLALEWFTKSGPFWDDTRSVQDEDYFHWRGEDVTDQGLGEAARVALGGAPAGVFSFRCPRFKHTPVTVQHGLPEDPLGEVALTNVWTIADLEVYKGRRLESWAGMLEDATSHCNLLILSDQIQRQLAPSPFHVGIASRIVQLLTVLNKLAEETLEDGSLTAAGMDLKQTFFVGGKAAFTDESDSNKSAFAAELQFPDPLNSNVMLECPWHGKIKNQQFRIHFEWPRPQGQRHVKVVYIGPKITKR